MSCPSKERLVAYLDGELAENELKAVAAHLETCQACRAQERAYTGTFEALEVLDSVEPSRAFVAQVMSRTERSRSTTGEAVRLVLRPRNLAALAAAAAVILAFAIGFYMDGIGMTPTVSERPIAVAEEELAQNIVAFENLESMSNAQLYAYVVSWNGVSEDAQVQDDSTTLVF